MEFSVTLLLSCAKPDRSDYAKRFDHALELINLKEMQEQVSPALLTIPIGYQQTIPFQLCRDISYLKLETNPDCIIGEITKIKAFGEGPLEIGNPQDFDFTPGDDELVVYEGLRNKLGYG